MAGSRNQSFDDRDSDHLYYQGSWARQKTYNATNTGETGTLASSNDRNANVTFTFPLKAIAFYYHGLKKANTRFAICIDCDPNDRHFEIVDAANHSDDGRNPPVLLYSHRFSSPGVHEVIIRNDRDPDTPYNQLEFTVDRIEIEIPAENSQPREVPIGAIVGGTVGGIVGILVIGAIAFCFWRRKKTQRRIREHVGNRGFAGPSPTTYQPFNPTPIIQMQSTTTGTIGGRKSRIPQNPPLQVLSSPLSGLASTSSRPETSQREVDAGPVDDHTRHNNVHDQLLPPEYEHVFVSGGSSAPNTQSRPRAKR